MAKKRQRKLTKFGRIIKKRLIDKGMTQVQLANEIGVSDKYLNLIIYGERSGKKYIHIMVTTLGIDPDILKKIA